MQVPLSVVTIPPNRTEAGVWQSICAAEARNTPTQTNYTTERRTHTHTHCTFSSNSLSYKIQTQTRVVRRAGHDVRFTIYLHTTPFNKKVLCNAIAFCPQYIYIWRQKQHIPHSHTFISKRQNIQFYINSHSY